MKLRRHLSPSLRSLGAHRLRAALAAGSVAVGVAAVLVTSGVGNGARAEVARSLGSMAGDLVTVRPAQVTRFAARKALTGSVSTLRPEDAAAIAELPAVKRLSPVAETRALLKADGTSTAAAVFGVGPDYARLRRFRLAKGRFLDPEDDRTAARVAVLGARVAGTLFGGEEPLGRTVRIRRVPFEVVGVLAPRGASMDGADEDDLVAIPLTTALRRVLNVRALFGVVVALRDPAGEARKGEAQIRDLLRRRHRLEARGAPDDFAIQSQEKVVAMQRAATRSLSLLTTGLGGVALAVGGAGILALMLLAVRERTAEIGLRMAVGATPADVLLQFLGEAALLAIGGGAAGALLGALGAAGVKAATGWKLAVPIAAYGAALATSLVTGLAAGALPAWRAASVPPVEALGTR